MDKAIREIEKIQHLARKINNAEHQLAFISFLRLIADDEIKPEEAVHAYHSVLTKLKISPYRSLQDDMKITNTSVSYSGSSSVSVLRSVPENTGQFPQNPDGSPDFKNMTSAQKLAFNRAKLK